MSVETIKVKCILDDANVVFQYEAGQSVKEIMKACQSLKPGSENKIPKLYDENGSLVPIGPKSLLNSSGTSYKLVFVDGIFPFPLVTLQSDFLRSGTCHLDFENRRKGHYRQGTRHPEQEDKCMKSIIHFG